VLGCHLGAAGHFVRDDQIMVGIDRHLHVIADYPNQAGSPVATTV
jgi:hypothetical protein